MDNLRLYYYPQDLRVRKHTGYVVPAKAGVHSQMVQIVQYVDTFLPSRERQIT